MACRQMAISSLVIPADVTRWSARNYAIGTTNAASRITVTAVLNDPFMQWTAIVWIRHVWVGIVNDRWEVRVYLPQSSLQPLWRCPGPPEAQQPMT
jgi:hypothetical protein